jgi:hypothetical protein
MLKVLVVQVTLTLVTVPVTVPEALPTLQVCPVGCVLTAAA